MGLVLPTGLVFVVGIATDSEVSEIGPSMVGTVSYHLRTCRWSPAGLVTGRIRVAWPVLPGWPVPVSSRTSCDGPGQVDGQITNPDNQLLDEESDQGGTTRPNHWRWNCERNTKGTDD